MIFFRKEEPLDSDHQNLRGIMTIYHHAVVAWGITSFVAFNSALTNEESLDLGTFNLTAALISLALLGYYLRKFLQERKNLKKEYREMFSKEYLDNYTRIYTVVGLLVIAAFFLLPLSMPESMGFTYSDYYQSHNSGKGEKPTIESLHKRIEGNLKESFPDYVSSIELKDEFFEVKMSKEHDGYEYAGEMKLHYSNYWPSRIDRWEVTVKIKENFYLKKWLLVYSGRIDSEKKYFKKQFLDLVEVKNKAALASDFYKIKLTDDE